MCGVECCCGGGELRAGWLIEGRFLGEVTHLGTELLLLGVDRFEKAVEGVKVREGLEFVV